MKKIKKSTWITLALFIYVTASVIYLLPKNEEMSSVEKIVVISYLLIVGLWFFLRKKEKMQKEREDDLNKNNK